MMGCLRSIPAILFTNQFITLQKGPSREKTLSGNAQNLTVKKRNQFRPGNDPLADNPGSRQGDIQNRASQAPCGLPAIEDGIHPVPYRAEDLGSNGSAWLAGKIRARRGYGPPDGVDQSLRNGVGGKADPNRARSSGEEGGKPGRGFEN